MTTTAVRRHTREVLLDEAERLMAIEGVQGTPTRAIVEAAGQRNPSAIAYHFGSRRNLLLEVLSRRGGPVDEERGRRRDELGESPALRDLVACLVEPYAALLGSRPGRSYVRIVAQLRGRFAVWRVESDELTTRNLARVIDEIESGLAVDGAVRRERIVAMMMVLTGVVAERARRIEDGTGNELASEPFVANLIDMCTSLLAGPVDLP